MNAARGDSAPALARRVAAALRASGARLATAESCTGGLIAKLLTDIPGSSAYFERGVVSYSNTSKTELLGVPPELLARGGAVSGQTVMAMAGGLLARAPVQWTLAVSGIAGPDGGTPDKPVGTVWIAWAGTSCAVSASCFRFEGNRNSIRTQSAAAALRGLLGLIDG